MENVKIAAMQCIEQFRTRFIELELKHWKFGISKRVRKHFIFISSLRAAHKLEISNPLHLEEKNYQMTKGYNLKIISFQF